MMDRAQMLVNITSVLLNRNQGGSPGVCVCARTRSCLRAHTHAYVFMAQMLVNTTSSLLPNQQGAPQVCGYG